MSIIKKLSNVLKEVFWIKTSSLKKPAKRSKIAIKKIPKKSKSSRVSTFSQKKPLKSAKIVKIAKISVSAKSKKPLVDSHLVQVGEITHYFERINVCVVKITQGTILIGDKLTMVGQKNKFIQKVWSMQIESQDVKVAKKGQLIGLKVDKPVTVADLVYK